MLFILFIFTSVAWIFYSEILNNYKIAKVKKNFIIVKDELNENMKFCANKDKNWFFGGSCSQVPSLERIVQYIDTKHNIVNPYNNKIGLGDQPGSVLINIENNKIVISVDYDVDGGRDIVHTFKIK